MEDLDYFTILGVNKDSSISEIKKSYHKLALQYHPDKYNEYKEEYTKIFQKISEAYETLSDEDKRKEYESNLTNIHPPLAEVCGKVDYVNKTNRSLFSIYAKNSDKRYRCIYQGFCPLREGDALLGLAKLTKDKRYGDTLIFESAPFISMGTDEDTILKNFTTALKKAGCAVKKAKGILQVLTKNQLEEGIEELDDLSVKMYYEGKDLTFNPQYDSDISIIKFSQVCDEKSMKILLSWWYKNRVLRNLYLLGLNNKQIKNSKMNPLLLHHKCLDNPYLVPSISLEKCEEILSRCGKQVDDKYKECGRMIRKVVNLMDNNGWTGIPINFISKIFPNICNYMEMLQTEFNVRCEMKTLYLDYAYEVEENISQLIKHLLTTSSIYDVQNDITYTRDDLSEEQKEAVKMALSNNVSIITGGGGTGKTITIKEIISNLEKNGISYQVAAFTGKAVSRVKEVTGKKDAMTLNMLISSSNEKKKNNFKHLIVEEASMVTTELFHEFRNRFSHDYKITFVGDPHQLTPISWGTLFEQLIFSQKLPITTLKIIHRTENFESNGILINSLNIIEHKDENYNGPSFELILTPNFKAINGDLKIVKQLIEVLNNSGTPSDKIVIISPYNRDLELINSDCSSLYNGMNRAVKDSRGKLWRIGDRVMNVINNYKVGLMNGDEGIITDVSPKGVLVKFKEGSFLYYLECNASEEDDDDTNTELTCRQLILSFALSVHKMQGSERDYVIGYIPKGSPGSTFLNANLFYTLITRAKKIIWLIGDIETMERCAVTKSAYRCDNLALRICSSDE